MENPTVKATAVPISDANSLHWLRDDEELGEVRDYQRKIGSMMFAMVYSRPDICFAMLKLSQYMSNPSIHHETVVKHLLRYLRTTKAFRICYRAQSRPEQIIGYSDSDFASDKDDRRSVSGFIFKFAGGPISWASRKQKSVTTSIAEVELMALILATKHAIWLSKFLNEIGRSKFIRTNGRTIVMNKDNQAAIKMVSNNQITERSKHINIGCHFIRERSENQDIKIHYCHTDKMAADGCIKGLLSAKFDTFLRLLSLKVFKGEAAYRVQSIISRFPFTLRSDRHLLPPANNISESHNALLAIYPYVPDENIFKASYGSAFAMLVASTISALCLLGLCLLGYVPLGFVYWFAPPASLYAILFFYFL